MYRKLPNRFSETRIDDEVVLMDLSSGSFFSLVGTAEAIWSCLDGAHDRAAILAQLAADFSGDTGQLAADFDAFIAQLLAAGFIENG